MADEQRPGVDDTNEFFENQSEVNAQASSLNAKRTFDEFQDISLVSARRSQSHYDDLQSRTLNSLDSLQTLQSKINNEHFEGINELRKHLANIQTDRQRHADIWAYEAAYDLGNPVTTGAGDALRGGVGVAAEAVAAAVAKQVDATITPLLAILQQIVSAIAASNASIANVLAQTQPKTP